MKVKDDYSSRKAEGMKPGDAFRYGEAVWVVIAGDRVSTKGVVLVAASLASGAVSGFTALEARDAELLPHAIVVTGGII